MQKEIKRVTHTDARALFVPKRERPRLLLLPTFAQHQHNPDDTGFAMSTSPLPPGRQQSKSNLNPEEARKILTEEHIGRLTEEAIQKLAEYTRKQALGNHISLDVHVRNRKMLTPSFLATVEDCQLLETMNKMTKDKYSQLSSMSQRLIQEMSKIQDTRKFEIVV